jgi:hypothetical protein
MHPSDHEPESALSLRLAAWLALGWSGLWQYENAVDLNAGEALRMARTAYDLSRELTAVHPEVDGLHDYLDEADTLLTTLGDGYALLSGDWPSGFPCDAMPDKLLTLRTPQPADGST